jgi:hypothetical protein
VTNTESLIVMPELSLAQTQSELKRLYEENEELRHKVKESDRLKAIGTFTIPDIMAMRGLDSPGDICDTCKGLGVSPHGTNRRCQGCGGSGNAKDHWVVLQ